jgi:hypothetical protein
MSQSPPFGTEHPLWRPSWACAHSPHLRLGYSFDTTCNTPAPIGMILSAMGQTRTVLLLSLPPKGNLVFLVVSISV